MNNLKNPFEYEGANNLSEDDIIDFYIEDYNFSRFIQSTRNVILIGERGSGKTMTLLYNSFKIQYKKSILQQKTPSFEKIGIHIPCNTPLFHKKEYLLLDNDFKKSVICEHYLVLSIIYALAETLADIKEIKQETKKIETQLFEEIEYILGIQLNKQFDFFSSIQKFAYKEIIDTQKQINTYGTEAFYENALSFSSIVMPLLSTIKNIRLLENSHFLLMIDDAHDMNLYQIRTLNSWIAYRDHSNFSFKVATAKVNRPELITSTGGSILEGHDFISVDMEKSFQNENSDFYKMAREIIERRLTNININIPVEEFFPVNIAFAEDLKQSKEKALQDAHNKYPNGTQKQINDYVYKYERVEYFRQRASKANLPPYSGFETITDISTGVIRNLLDPCFWMYDYEISQRNCEIIKSIPPSTQNHIIIDRSKKLWEILQNGLNKIVEDCSEEQAKQIYQLFDNLILLFKKRLLEHKSEPRAIVFTISQKETHISFYTKVIELLNIARRAQFLYTRVGSAKELGKQEIYYVPNRLLFPSRGLDPHGQYSRVSIKATDLLNAAERNIPIPFSSDENEGLHVQTRLFEDE